MDYEGVHVRIKGFGDGRTYKEGRRNVGYIFRGLGEMQHGVKDEGIYIRDAKYSGIPISSVREATEKE